MLKTAITQRLVLFVFLLICFTSCNEDNAVVPTGEGSINGVVLDSETNLPMYGVAISTNPASTAVATDENGKFRITNVAGGNYSVTAKKTGYKNESVSVAVKNDKQTEVMILMRSEGALNNTPGSPTNPEPQENATNQAIGDTLRWSAPETRKGEDSVFTYDVYLYESGSTHKQMIKEATPDTMAAVSNLKYNTTYFWQVIVKNSQGKSTNGPVWSFSTQAMPVARFVFAREVDGNYDIYSSDGTPENVFRLTDGFSREWWPVISPIRDKIAYSSNMGLEPHIYLMDRDGYNKRQLTTIPVVGYHNQGIGFTWSPDGGQLLYANYDNLYRIDRNGTGLKLIAKAPANRHFRMLDWTASGDKIVAQTIGSNINDSEIYIMNADGSNMTLLVSNLPGRVESPSFSIDGKMLLYSRDADGFENAEGRQLNSRIYLRNIATGEETELSRNKTAGTNDLHPRFSPDGARIIFVNAPNDNQGPVSVWTMDISGGSRTQLFTNATMPDWK